MKSPVEFFIKVTNLRSSESDEVVSCYKIVETIFIFYFENHPLIRKPEIQNVIFFPDLPRKSV